MVKYIPKGGVAMKDATLAQGNQVLNLILQKQTPAEQLQTLIQSGLLSDLLDANVEEVNRDKFREVIGLRGPKVLKYQFVLEGGSPTDESVEREAKRLLGAVSISRWYVVDDRHFFGAVTGRGRKPEDPPLIYVEYTKK